MIDARSITNAMGNRLSKIYTRTGDDGTTGLAGNERVDKFNPRIEAIGAVDELSSALGVLLAEDDLPAAVRESLERVQHELFDIGANLAMPAYERITATDVDRLEAELDGLNATLPPLREFVLPGGNRAAALCHVARAAARRAERRAWAAAREHAVGRASLTYLNRLSDLLFVVARTLARQDGRGETLWRHER